MMKNPQRYLRIGALILLAGVSSLAMAQQPIPPSKGQPPAKAGPAAPPPAGDAGLRQRIEQLEEQLVDLQVVVGTLESLARGASAPSGAPAGRPGPSMASGAAEAGRLDSIETQIRALAAQLEQVQEQVRALAGRGPQPQAAVEPGPVPRPGRPPVEPDRSQPPPERTGFGSVTVKPDEPRKDEIDRILNTPPPSNAGPQEQDANSKQLYETAYGYLLQRDYGAAEAAFEDFLRRHPNDPLAGNAQYWLGESLYVRGQYRAAAGAFLKGYQTYSRSQKASENLLKLAMSLQRLGQKDAACSSFSELSVKFPSAPAHVKTTAQSERQRAGC